MSANNNVTQKLEQAATGWLATQNLGDIPVANVFRGLEKSERVLPCICFESREADAQLDAVFSGSWKAKGYLLIRTQCDDAEDEDEHMERAGAIINLFMSTTIAADLTGALADFTAFLVVVRRQSHAIDERSWVSVYEMDVDCCGSDIS